MVKLRRVNKIEESYSLYLESKKDLEELKDFLGDIYFNKYMDIRDRISDPDFKDFNKIKKMDLKDVQNFIDSFQSRGSKKKQDKTEGAEKVYEDGDWIVYHITSYPAAQLYGSGTKWCITGRYDGHEEKGEYYFNDYIKAENLDGGYYFYINKKDPSKKYCMLLDKNKEIRSIWSADDTNIRDADIDDIPSDLPNIKGVDVKEYIDTYGNTASNLVQGLNDEIWKDNPDLHKIDRIAAALKREDVDGEDIKDIFSSLYSHDDPVSILKILTKHFSVPTRIPVAYMDMDSTWDVIKLYLEEVANKNKYSDKHRNNILLSLSGLVSFKYKNKLESLVKQIQNVVKSGVDGNMEWIHSFPYSILNDKQVLENLDFDRLLDAAFETEPEDILLPLLENGMSVDTEFENGDNIFISAVENDKPDFVDMLLKYGADPNIIYGDSYPYPVWLVAVEDGLPDTLKVLIKHGANVKTWKDSDGKTALDYTDDPEIKDILEK